MSLELKLRSACKLLQILQSGQAVIFGWRACARLTVSTLHESQRKQKANPGGGGRRTFSLSKEDCWNHSERIFWVTSRASGYDGAESYCCFDLLIFSTSGQLEELKNYTYSRNVPKPCEGVSSLILGHLQLIWWWRWGNQPKCKKSPLPFLSTHISLHSISWTML